MGDDWRGHVEGFRFRRALAYIHEAPWPGLELGDVVQVTQDGETIMACVTGLAYEPDRCVIDLLEVFPGTGSAEGRWL